MDFSSFGPMTSFLRNDAAFNFSMKPLSQQQQNHMKLVFATLAAGIISTGVGAYVSFTLFTIPPFLALIAQLGAVLYVSGTSQPFDDSKIRHPKRLIAVLTASFFAGCSIMPLLAFANFVNPAIVIQAFFITAAIFACFFLAAVFARDRSHLYLGAILGSITSCLSLVAFANIFFHSAIGHNIIVYGGLLVAVGYLYYFTQKTLVDFERGNRDYVLQGLQFYLELLSIFIRVVIILTEREAKKQREERDKRNRD